NYKNIESILADDSFIRWIEDRASQKEIEKWEAWIGEDPVHESVAGKAERFHHSLRFRRRARPEMDSELQRLNDSIDRLERADNSYKSPRPNNYFRPTQWLWFAAAASLLIVALVGGLYISHSEGPKTGKAEADDAVFITKSTPFGEKKRLTLSDGSTVLINSNSTLRFPETHTGSFELWLRGEAYFNIVRNPQGKERSVTVHTADGEVRVLGTEFNVNTFKKGTEVVLKKGKVAVKVKETVNDDFGSEQLMKPGQRSLFSANKEKVLIEPVNISLYTAWTENKLVFEHTSVFDIAKRLENIYGAEVVVDSTVKDIKITGSVPNHNLSVLLNGLKKILQKPVRQTKDIIRIG